MIVISATNLRKDLEAYCKSLPVLTSIADIDTSFPNKNSKSTKCQISINIVGDRNIGRFITDREKASEIQFDCYAQHNLALTAPGALNDTLNLIIPKFQYENGNFHKIREFPVLYVEDLILYYTSHIWRFYFSSN